MAVVQQYLYGSVAYDASGIGGQVFEFYEGLLGRDPDALGYEFWIVQSGAGARPEDIAAGFLASPEYAGRNDSPAALSNADFVESLYGNVLHRASDADGKSFWISALDAGTSRGAVAAGFALSPEHVDETAPVLQSGVFAPGFAASDVARLYIGLLGRGEDPAGLQYWVDLIGKGASEHDVAASFLASPEYASRYGTPTNGTFIDELYRNALGREPDAGGRAFWETALANGVDRASVALGIVESREGKDHLFGAVDAFALYQGPGQGVPPAVADLDRTANAVPEGAASGTRPGSTSPGACGARRVSSSA